MPIYEYKCIDCGAHTEKLQKRNDPALTLCEACGGRLEKQTSLSGFQFKGAGWYVTDYAGKKGITSGEKSDTESKSTKSESTDSKDTASKKEKTESTAKPAEKKETKS